MFLLFRVKVMFYSFSIGAALSSSGLLPHRQGPDLLLQASSQQMRISELTCWLLVLSNKTLPCLRGSKTNLILNPAGQTPSNRQ